MNPLKPAVAIRFDFAVIAEELEAEDYKALMSGVFQYAQTGEEPELEDKRLKRLFKTVRPWIDADDRKFTARSAHAKKAADSRWSKEDRSEMPEQGNIIPIPTSDTGSSSSHPQAASEGERRPTLEEVEQEIKLQGYPCSAAAFLSYMDAAGWKDKHGYVVRNWRAYLRGFDQLGMSRGGGNASAGYEERTYTRDELEAMKLSDEEIRKLGSGEARI